LSEIDFSAQKDVLDFFFPGLIFTFKLRNVMYKGPNNVRNWYVGYILLIIQHQNEAIYNIALYILPNINLFMVLIAINNYYNKEDINNIRELSGFFENNPFMLLTFVISIFSIAGVPPLPGFFAKYNL
jgi:NADH-quinone oxidoreductase subunit N